jgi:glycosyltransferase involved in cell wall biosynthesis
MKLIRKIVHALAWRARIFLRPFLKPFQRILESPAAEKIVYAITEWRFDLMSKGKPKSTASTPEVSIVIPIYNVAQYLSVCVKSALLQTHPNVRIILVDDGSTDNSGQIAKAFADRFENVELVTQKNAGLAAARNTGVDAIKKTDYLLFLDSDDVLPLKTVENYLKAVGSLNVVVGKPTRLKGFALYKRSREVFNRPVAKTTLASRVDFLSDVTAWNKLLRFDFWKSGGYRFPVGYLYEDMALMTRVYAESGGFAVVTSTSYYWRSRLGGGTSITQERWQMKNLEHRLKAIEDTLSVLEEFYPRTNDTKALWDYYHWSTARFDINFFMPWVEHTDQKYFDTLHATAKRLYKQVDSMFWKKVPERYRPALKALIANDRQGVIAAIAKARLSVPKPAK